MLVVETQTEGGAGLTQPGRPASAEPSHTPGCPRGQPCGPGPLPHSPGEEINQHGHMPSINQSHKVTWHRPVPKVTCSAAKLTVESTPLPSPSPPESRRRLEEDEGVTFTPPLDKQDGGGGGGGEGGGGGASLFVN